MPSPCYERTPPRLSRRGEEEPKNDTLSKRTGDKLGELIEIACPVRWLGGRRGRRCPGHVYEIEELSHIHLRRITLGKTGKIEACFHQLQPSRVVRYGVGNVILLGEWRNHQQRNSIPRINEVASRPSCFGANIPRKQVQWLDAIRTHGRLRWNMIVESAELIIGEDKHRI